MYVVTRPAEVPKCELAPVKPAGLGDIQSGFQSFSKALGTTPGALLLIGGGALVAGWALNSLISGARRNIRRKRAALRRRTRRVKETVSEVSRQALSHQTPTWQTLLLVLVAGGAVWYFATRAGKGQQA